MIYLNQEYDKEFAFEADSICEFHRDKAIVTIVTAAFIHTFDLKTVDKAKALMNEIFMDKNITLGEEE